MITNSIIKQSSFESVLKSASVISPKGERHKRNIVADLLLTALIDAFSILVIFLLMNFSSSGEILLLSKGTELPKAGGEALDRHPVVKIENAKVFIEEKEIPQAQLVEALLGLRKQWQDTHPGEEFPAMLTIQADRRMKYEEMNSVVLASSHAGFSDLKFAVIMK